MSSKLDRKATKMYLLRFALPTIVSYLFMSLFGIVDGLFVSRFVDPIALSAVGIVFPFLMFASVLGIMLGAGGNALVAKRLGEGVNIQARQNFSMLSVVALLVSVLISAVALVFPMEVLAMLGADYSVYEMALEYMLPLLWFMPSITMNFFFQYFLITEGKAYINTLMTVIGGIFGVILNYLFIYVLLYCLVCRTFSLIVLGEFTS